MACYPGYGSEPLASSTILAILQKFIDILFPRLQASRRLVGALLFSVCPSPLTALMTHSHKPGVEWCTAAALVCAESLSLDTTFISVL